MADGDIILTEEQATEVSNTCKAIWGAHANDRLLFTYVVMSLSAQVVLATHADEGREFLAKQSEAWGEWVKRTVLGTFDEKEMGEPKTKTLQ
jgi:hypothetical protein